MNKVNKKIIIISTIILALVCVFVCIILLGKNKEPDKQKKENEVIENVELDNHIIKISEYKFSEATLCGTCVFVIEEKSGREIYIPNDSLTSFDNYDFGINSANSGIDDLEYIINKDNTVTVKISFMNSKILPETKLVFRDESTEKVAADFKFQDTGEQYICLQNSDRKIYITEEALRIEQYKNGYHGKNTQITINYKDGTTSVVSTETLGEYGQHISSGNCIITSDNMDIVLENVESIIYEEERYELISQ